MNWRTLVYERLAADSAVTAIAGDRIFSTLENAPSLRPFVVIRVDPTVKDRVGDFQDATIWVHDEPKGYTVIDQLIAAIKSALVGPVHDPDGVLVEWQGDSGDLADDVWGTVLRTSSYRFAGRRSA